MMLLAQVSWISMVSQKKKKEKYLSLLIKTDERYGWGKVANLNRFLWRDSYWWVYVPS